MGSLSSSMASSMTSLSSSLTGSMGSLSSSMVTSMNSLSSSMGSIMATTGSNLFKGDQTISGSIIPAVNSSYDLGSPTNEFRHLYLSSASLYIDGTKVLGSTTQELQITTDTGQSFKILEAGSDTITLQAADGNITLATSGGGDVILDPTSGVIALKGTTTLYAGNKILSSDGNAIQIGNSVTMTGSLIVTGFIETQELRTTYISSSILYRSGSTKFGDELTDTHSFTGSLSVSGSISIPESGLVSGSSQITYSGLSGVPSGIISGSAQLPSGLVSGSSQVLNGSGIWSGSAQLPSGIVSSSAQTIANLPSGVVSGSAQTIANLPSGTVSGSVQVSFTGTTGYSTYINQAVLTSSSPTFAGLTNNGTYTQTTTSTQPVMIYGDSAGSNGLFRIQIDEVNDSFGTGARTFLGDGGIDIFLGTSNSSYTPGNTYIALNHGGEISMGAGSATKHLILSTGGTATFSGSVGVGGSLTTTGDINVNSSGIIINRNTSGEPYLFFRKDGVNRGSIYGITGGGLRMFDQSDNQVLTMTGSMIGINKSSPSGTLDVQSSGANGIVLSSDSADTNNSGRLFFMRTGGEGFAIMNNSGNLSFRSNSIPGNTSGNERMKLDSSYNLILNNGLTVAGATNHTGAVRMNNASAGNSPKITFGEEGESVAGNKSIYLDTYWMILQPHVNEGLRVRFVNGAGAQTETVRLQSTQASFYTSISSSSSISASGNMGARNFNNLVRSWSSNGSYVWHEQLNAIASVFDDGGLYRAFIRESNAAHYYGYMFDINVSSKGYGGTSLQYVVRNMTSSNGAWPAGCGATSFASIDNSGFTKQSSGCFDTLHLYITKIGG